MTRILTLLICLTLGSGLAAEPPMSAAEFEAYTTGRTLFYVQDGVPYGAERYLEDRRVEWSFLDGECKEGVWYERGPDICFVYEDDPEPHCWQFRRSPGGLVAEFRDNSSTVPLYEARTGEEMICLGPKVGV